METYCTPRLPLSLFRGEQVVLTRGWTSTRELLSVSRGLAEDMAGLNAYFIWLDKSLWDDLREACYNESLLKKCSYISASCKADVILDDFKENCKRRDVAREKRMSGKNILI